MSGLIAFLLVFFHIALSVSISLVTLFIAMQVSCMFFLVVCLGLGCIHSRIPLCAVAFVKMDSFAPLMLNLSDISRFIGSGLL